MLTTLLLAAMMSSATVAQTTVPAPPPAALAAPAAILNNGPCLDSDRAVPQVLAPPIVSSRQIVRIEKVVSTATMLDGNVIGFLYTLNDGTTWLGQRSAQYMSPAQASQINQVLASTHSADSNVTEFPPQTRLGVATKFQQFFKVQIPSAATAALNIRLDPCIAWPAGMALPNPSMQ